MEIMLEQIKIMFDIHKDIWHVETKKLIHLEQCIGENGEEVESVYG